MSPLLSLIIIPLLSAVTCFLVPSRARFTAMLGTSLNFLLCVGLVVGYRPAGDGEFSFLMQWPVLPGLGIHFLLGVDGFSLVMLLLSGVVSLCAVWASPDPGKSPGLYFGNILLISAGVMGAFTSLDVFFFYAFHELALIPTFLLIGIWGSGDRQAVAWKATIYLAFGSFVLLLGLIGLFLAMPGDTPTFDMRQWIAVGRLGEINPPAWVYFALLFGFGTLVSLFPFHTWAPAAYASAPSPASMLHAGVLKKFGLYGLLRLVVPIFPGAMIEWANLLLVLIACNILYVGYVTMAQKRLDWMIGYSSVMHMGYLFLGFAGGIYNTLSLTGAGMLIFGHGLSVAALFALAGQLRAKTGTLEFSELGGLGRVMPMAGLLFGFATMASIGLPGFANFAGEVMVFFGAFAGGGEAFLNAFQVVTVAAVWGVVISAVYGLRAYRWVFFGEMPERWAGLKDCAPGALMPVVLLIVFSMIVGFYPQLLISLLTPSLLVP